MKTTHVLLLAAAAGVAYWWWRRRQAPALGFEVGAGTVSPV